MRIKNTVLNVAIILGVSSLIVSAVYSFNLWIYTLITVEGSVSDPEARAWANDFLLLEGILFPLGGFLLLLGEGEMDWRTRRRREQDRLSGEEPDEQRMQPSEIFRADRSAGRGFVRIALSLILSGIFMILICFHNL